MLDVPGVCSSRIKLGCRRPSALIDKVEMGIENNDEHFCAQAVRIDFDRTSDLRFNDKHWLKVIQQLFELSYEQKIARSRSFCGRSAFDGLLAEISPSILQRQRRVL